MKYFVTGGAGFIGSTLVDRLLGSGHEVVCFDNFSTGQMEFLQNAGLHAAFQLVRGDLLDLPKLTGAMRGCEFVFHLAANADVRFGTEHPQKDLEQNTVATFHVLEAMRSNGIREIAFTSTGSIYGEPAIYPTPEEAPFPVQTSLYGASKLACEGLITAYCEGFGFRSWIFRLVSILGERYTHGHVFDFCKQLREHPERLEALGDGKQKKSYLYVQDCVDALLLAPTKARRQVNILNLGSNEYCALYESIGWIAAELKLRPRVSYSGGQRGWVGDSPYILLDCTRMRNLGWSPKLAIREAVIRTIRDLERNALVFGSGR